MNKPKYEESDRELQTLTCKYCRKAQVQLVDCRSYQDPNSSKFWLYECPNCHEGCVAKKSEFSDVPIVAWLAPRSEDPTTDDDIGGVKEHCGYDILAANPTGLEEHDSDRVYWEQR